MRWTAAVVGVWLVFTGTGAHAQQPPQAPGPAGPVAAAVTAADLFPRVEAGYPSLVGAREARRVAEFRAAAAGALPPVRLDVGHGFGTGATGTDEDILITARLELGGKGRLREAVARREVEAARAREAQARAEALFLLRSRFANLQAAQAEEELAAEYVRVAREFLRVARIRFDAGDVSLTNVVRAELEVENAEQALVGASAATAARRAPVNTLIGAAPDAPLTAVSLPAVPLAPLQPPELDLKTLRAEALRHPALAAAEATLEARRAAVASARASRRPDLTLQAAHGHLDESSGNVLRLGIEFPIWDFGVTRAQTQAARAAAAEQSAAVDLLRREALQDVEVAYRNLLAAQEQARRLGGPQLERARRLRDLSEAAYREGHSSYVELLDGQRAYLATFTQYQRALAAAVTAEAALARAVGATALGRAPGPPR